jgi:hypothetical protein
MSENPLFLFDTEKSLSNQGIPGLVGGKSPIVLTEYALLVRESALHELVPSSLFVLSCGT